VVQNHAALDEVMSEGETPDLETLDMLLSSLSAGERSVMLLTYRDGYRAREVAEKLGKTENAVKLILSRSRKKLRSVLS
jgi:RNA polymerase sigma factor (sigma-70 family)